MNEGLRQGLFIIFVMLLAFSNAFFEWLTFFEFMIICIGAMMIVKLSDIQDAIATKN